MGWPLLWTSVEIDYNSKAYENKLTIKKVAKSNEAHQELPDLQHISGETPGSPQRQGQSEYRAEQLTEAMSDLPHVNPCEGWRLGEWKVEVETGGVQDLRHVIHSASLSFSQKQFIVWLAAMRGREWAAECFEAMGQTPRVAHGVKDRVDRLKAIGNGQVPQCAALAWRILTATPTTNQK